MFILFAEINIKLDLMILIINKIRNKKHISIDIFRYLHILIDNFKI